MLVQRERNVVLAGSEMWLWPGAKCGCVGRERNVVVAGGNDPLNPCLLFDQMMNSWNNFSCTTDDDDDIIINSNLYL